MGSYLVLWHEKGPMIDVSKLKIFGSTSLSAESDEEAEKKARQLRQDIEELARDKDPAFRRLVSSEGIKQGATLVKVLARV